MHWQAPIDFLTLVLIIVAGLELGVVGLFGFSLINWLSSNWKSTIYIVIGFSSLWQLSRQRFLG